MASGKSVESVEEKGAAALPDPVFVGRLAGFRQDHSHEGLGMVPEHFAVG